MPNSTMSLEAIQAQAVEAIRQYRTGPEGVDRTEALRSVASSFIDAREHFFTREGEPDWLGRTYAYRTWVREVMSLAHVPADELTNIQAAIRYHSGNLLRERLDDDTLADLGLRTSSPRERSIEKRERHSATLSVFGGGGGELRSVDEILYALRTMDATLARITPSAVRALAPKERRATVEALRELCKRAEETAAEVEKR